MAAESSQPAYQIPVHCRFRFPCYTWKPEFASETYAKFWTPWRETGPKDSIGAIVYCLELFSENDGFKTYHSPDEDLLFGRFMHFVKTVNYCAHPVVSILIDEKRKKEVKIPFGSDYNIQTVKSTLASSPNTPLKYYWDYWTCAMQFLFRTDYNIDGEPFPFEETDCFVLKFTHKLDDDMERIETTVCKYFLELFIIFIYEGRKRDIFACKSLVMKGETPREMPFYLLVTGDQHKEFSFQNYSTGIERNI